MRVIAIETIKSSNLLLSKTQTSVSFVMQCIDCFCLIGIDFKAKLISIKAKC